MKWGGGSQAYLAYLFLCMRNIFFSRLPNLFLAAESLYSVRTVERRGLRRERKHEAARTGRSRSRDPGLQNERKSRKRGHHTSRANQSSAHTSNSTARQRRAAPQNPSNQTNHHPTAPPSQANSLALEERAQRTPGHTMRPNEHAG